MKVNIEIDCTPEEARAFFGLPDVKPIQETVLKEMQKQMLTNIEAMSPEAMLKTWFPATVQGWDELQKLFWSQLSAASKPEKSE